MPSQNGDPSAIVRRLTTTRVTHMCSYRKNPVLQPFSMLFFLMTVAFIGVSATSNEQIKQEQRQGEHHRSLQQDDTLVTVSDEGNIYLPDRYFDWTSYKRLQFGLTWNSEPNALIRDVLLPQALSFWTEALHVYPQEQPLQLQSPECSQVITDYAENGIFDGPDVILFITSSDNSQDADGQINTETCRSPVIASPCAYHPVTKRPIAGIIHFCNTATLSEDNLSDTVRQIGYMLGLNPRLYSNFINVKTQQFQTPNPGAIPGCTAVQMPSQQTISSFTSELVTPLALQVMRNHADCQLLAGIALTEDFCLGEPLLLWNTDDTANPITPLALALLEDSGWYAAHYEVASSPIKGRHMGCDYISTLTFDENGVLDDCDGTCSSEIANFPCDPSHSTVVSCMSRRDCPLAVDCRSGTTTSTMLPEETFGTSSKCFNTDNGVGRGVCLDTRCQDDGTILVMIAGSDYKCTMPGQEFSLSNDNDSIWKCPDSLEIVCPRGECPSQCVGQGICHVETNTCQCSDTDDKTKDCSARHAGIGTNYSPLTMSNKSDSGAIITAALSSWNVVIVLGWSAFFILSSLTSAL